MPIKDNRRPLIPANARAADVASQLTETISPIQQQRTNAAFRVQGFQCILYNRLTQGRQCPCCTKPSEVNKLNSDGSADTGTINRLITGQDNFGVTSYNPQGPTGNEWQGPTSDSFDPWQGDLVKIGDLEDDDSNVIQDFAELGDTGQFSPDLADLFGNIDISKLGLSDISCPICFGTNFVGGYSVYRGFRTVLIPQDLKSSAFLDVRTWELGAGTHTISLVLPAGALSLDAFRVMRGRNPIPFEIQIDGQPAGNRNLVDFFTGTTRTLVFTTTQPLTHIEIQGALSSESVYFEFPRRTNSGDIAMLEKTEPFQILMSPDVPHLDTLDVIVESQGGSALVVNTTNPWSTYRQNPLGSECQVRIAQPQELFTILPTRNPLIGVKPSRPTAPAKDQHLSGVDVSRVGLKSIRF